MSGIELDMPCGCPYPPFGSLARCIHGCNGSDDDYGVLPGVAAERELADKLAQLARELLSLFCEPGHPGHPCHRTGWISDEQLTAWRRHLADLIGGTDGGDQA